MLKAFNDEWHKGFHMTFENGWTVSVQFGKNNYVADRSNKGQSVNAEIAAWDKDGVWYRFPNGDTVQGWNSADDVADFIAKVAAL